MFIRMMQVLALAIVILVAILQGVVKSETLEVEYLPNGGAAILFEGEFTHETGKRLLSIIKETGAKTVVFNSPGGIAQEGYIVAWVLEDRGIHAVVRHGSSCMSACAIGVLGADTYTIKGILGFHPTYLPQEVGKPSEAFAEGQRVGMRNTFFLEDKGVSRQVIRTILYLADPKTFMVFTSNEDLSAIFTGKMTPSELVSHIWGPRELGMYHWLTKQGENLND